MYGLLTRLGSSDLIFLCLFSSSPVCWIVCCPIYLLFCVLPEKQKEQGSIGETLSWLSLVCHSKFLIRYLEIYVLEEVIELPHQDKHFSTGASFH